MEAPRDPQVIVVTGASAGVGRATARAFARPGAKLALLARCEEGLTAARDEVEAAGASAIALSADVADYDQVETAAERTESVPPIYQPEVAADAIVWAAHHPRREVLVGGSTVIAVLGERIAPALGDLYLARTGYDAQQADEPERERPDNLFQPVPGDQGAHGRFDGRSRERSLQLPATKHRALLVVAGGLLLAALSRR